MSNNCLVTKLKGSVQNDNLPIFGKLVLTLPVIEGGGSDSHRFFTFIAGSKPVTITSDVAFGNVTNPQYHEYTIQANTKFSGHFAEMNGGKVIIDAYNLKFYQCNAKEILGGDSLKYGELLGGQYSWYSDFGGNAANVLESSGKLIYYYADTNDLMDVSDIAEVVEYIHLVNPNVNSFPKLRGAFFISVNVGDLYLPSIESMGIGNPNGDTTGSFTQLINKLRSAGRTTGKLRVDNLFNPYTTIDNGSGVEIPLTTYAAQHSIDISQNANGVLEWTANSISASKDFTDTKTLSEMQNETLTKIENTIL